MDGVICTTYSGCLSWWRDKTTDNLPAEMTGNNNNDNDNDNNDDNNNNNNNNNNNKNIIIIISDETFCT